MWWPQWSVPACVLHVLHVQVSVRRLDLHSRLSQTRFSEKKSSSSATHEGLQSCQARRCPATPLRQFANAAQLIRKASQDTLGPG
jgi:hypothetical protein